MTFLAPWAIAIGGAAALGMVLLHLVAWQRPAAYTLPTTRFIPDQRTVVSRAATRPRDVLLLILRVLMLLAAATAFARPVMTPLHGSHARIVVVDVSASVGDVGDVGQRARAALAKESNDIVIAFDTAARVIAPSALDSLGKQTRVNRAGSISAGLALALRQGALLADQVDSIELVLISPVSSAELDAATGWLRAQWPGGVKLTRVAARKDSSLDWRLESSLPLNDPLGPAVRRIANTGGVATRLVRHVLTAADSTFAGNGGTVIHWDTTTATTAKPDGISTGEEVVVANFARLPLPAAGEVVVRWANGDAAAIEQAVGRGCVREVGIGVPAAGDLALLGPFQRVVRRLLAPCGMSAAEVPVDSATLTRVLGAAAGAAPTRALRSSDAPPTPLVKWLLAAALMLALSELAARLRFTRVLGT